MGKNSLAYKILFNLVFLIMFYFLFKESTKFDTIIILILVIIFTINLILIKYNNLKINFFMLILNTIIFFIFSYSLPVTLLFCWLWIIMGFPIDIYLANLNITNKKVPKIKPSIFLWFLSILNCLITLFMLWVVFKRELETLKPFSYFIIAILFILIVIFYLFKVISTIKKNKTEIRYKDSFLFLIFNYLIVLMYIAFHLIFHADTMNWIKWYVDFYFQYYILYLFLFINYFIWLNLFLKNYQKISNKT